jgi:hypothetical protein
LTNPNKEKGTVIDLSVLFLFAKKKKRGKKDA